MLERQIAEADSIAALREPADVLVAQWRMEPSDPLLPLFEKLLIALVRKSAELETKDEK